MRVVPWCVGMNASTASGRLCSRPSSSPAFTCSAMMSALMYGVIRSCGFSPGCWFSMKYSGRIIFPMS
jgi:hypothetical protein